MQTDAMSDMNKRPILLITGKSGVGKDTIADYLCDSFGYTKVKSYTTRQPRYEGEDTHIFVSKEEFDALKDKIAYTNRDDIEYCATQAQVDNADIYIIDPPGIQYFLQVYKGKRTPIIIAIDCSESERSQRVYNRCVDGNKELVNRQNLDSEFHVPLRHPYKYVINQDGNISSAINSIMSYVRKQTIGAGRLNRKLCFDKKKLIYVSHPFQNKPENVKDIEHYITMWERTYKDCVFVSPVHCFGFMYEKMSYEDGLDWCLQLLSICDEMWVCGDYEHSTGCQAEIEFCKDHYIPYKIKLRGVITLD